MNHSPSSVQSNLSDERIHELALLNLGYDRAIRPIDFARAIEREARAAASAPATTHPTPIAISTEKICEVAKKYNLGNPRLDALRGFVNEIIIVNGAEYAKSE